MNLFISHWSYWLRSIIHCVCLISLVLIDLKVLLTCYTRSCWRATAWCSNIKAYYTQHRTPCGQSSPACLPACLPAWLVSSSSSSSSCGHLWGQPQLTTSSFWSSNIWHHRISLGQAGGLFRFCEPSHFPNLLRWCLSPVKAQGFIDENWIQKMVNSIKWYWLLIGLCVNYCNKGKFSSATRSNYSPPPPPPPPPPIP